MGPNELLLRMAPGADLPLAELIGAVPDSAWFRAARLGEPVPVALARWNAAIEALGEDVRERAGLERRPAPLPPDDPVERARERLRELPSGTARPAGDIALAELERALAEHARLRRWSRHETSPFAVSAVLLTSVEQAARAYYRQTLADVRRRAIETSRTARERGRPDAASRFDALVLLAEALAQELQEVPHPCR